jgi:Domain of unknown function (DUF4157)
MRSILARTPTQLRPPARSAPALVGHHSGGAREVPVAGARASADRLEREADRIADRLVQPVSSATKPGCACGGGCPSCAASVASDSGLSPTITREPAPARSAGQGIALPASLRLRLEPTIGSDLSAVRVHTNEEAEALSGQLGANAFTYGQDIYMPRGSFRPGTPVGDRLLAHEAAHTVQQARGVPAIQRQPADQPAGQPATQPAPIATSALLGLPAGSQVVIARSMQDAMFRLLLSQAPDVAASLTAISGKQATVATTTEALLELRFNEPASIPAAGTAAARTIRNLTLRISRNADGTFDFAIAGEEGAGPVELFKLVNLTAQAQGGAFVLADGAVPQLRLTPAGGPTGTANIEAFTAPFLVGQPGWVRSLAPQTVGLVSVTGLPSAPAGSAQQREAVRRVLDRAASSTSTPRQTLTFGAGAIGGTGGPGLSGFLGATWLYSFQPFGLGDLTQIPLQVDLFYTPSSTVFGGVSAGFGTSLSSLKIPLNARIVGGLGGGAIEGAPDPTPGAEAPILPVFGPTFGAALGVEAGWFRVELRYDQLINVLPGPAPTSIPTGSLRIGGAF